jgi:hypothetical protein
MSLTLLAALLAAAPVAGAAAEDARAPLVSRNPDGSSTIHRAIEADPPRLRLATHGLAEGEWESDTEGSREAAEAAFEEDLREAFEEATDQARTSRPN